jgi:hypothetical protein
LLPEKSDVARRAANNKEDIAAIYRAAIPALAERLGKSIAETTVLVEAHIASPALDLQITNTAIVDSRFANNGDKYIPPSDAAVAARANEIKNSGQPEKPQPTDDTGISDIVVTAHRYANASDGIGLAVHDALGATGALYNDASPVQKHIFDISTSVVIDGPLGYVTGELIGRVGTAVAPDMMKAISTGFAKVAVGADSLLQDRQFSPVNTDNTNGVPNTANAVSGIGIVSNLVPGLKPLLKKFDAPPTPKVKPDTDYLNEGEANWGQGGNTPHGAPFTPDPNLPLSMEMQKHLINGDVHGSKSTGAHYAGSPNVKVDYSTAVHHPNGVFVANVEIGDGKGNFVPKSNSPAYFPGSNSSTFFPPSWTPDRIIGEVAAAAKKIGPDGIKETIITPSGVKLVITKKNNNVVQAYPEWPQ